MLKKVVVAGAKFWFYLCLCLCACVSSGSSEGEPQEKGDGGEDQESQAGKGEGRAWEAGAPAEEEAADWHEQRYATSPRAATEPEIGELGGREQEDGRGISWKSASHRFELKEEDSV